MSLIPKPLNSLTHTLEGQSPERRMHGPEKRVAVTGGGKLYKGPSKAGELAQPSDHQSTERRAGEHLEGSSRVQRPSAVNKGSV